MQFRTAILATLALLVAIPCAMAGPSCDLRPKDGRIDLALPLHPYMVASLGRACALLVTLSDDGEPARGAVAVLKMVEGKLTVASVLDLPTEPVGMAVTNDEKVAVIAGSSRIYFVDLPRLLAGQDAVVGTAEYDKEANTVSVLLSRDERMLLASDEGASKLTLIDIAAARASGFAQAPVLARIPVDWYPTSLKMTGDGKHALVPVQGVRREFKPPILCGAQPGGEAVNPVGAILSLDIARVAPQPESATFSRAFAGCSPVRLELSRDGRTAFVTNREENLLRLMDVAKILKGDTDATIATVPVGAAPVGVEVVDRDRLVVVSNSNRWAKDQTEQTIAIIDVAGEHRHQPVVLGKIPVGVFPRDLAVSRDGRTLIVSNFGSKSLTFLDVSKLRTLVRSGTTEPAGSQPH